MSDANKKKALVLVHGRGFKPDAEVHHELSAAAITAGIARDYPEQLDLLETIRTFVAWYGDLNAKQLLAAGKHYDETLDVSDRRTALSRLQAIKPRKKFGIRQYDQLPGKSALPEAMVNVFAPLLGSLGLCLPMIRMVTKDFHRYYDPKSDFAETARDRLRQQLCAAFDRGEEVSLLSHGTGCVIAYDVLWQLSHDSEYAQQYADKKVSLWLTLGAPLGDSGIRRRLLGAKEKGVRKHPTNLITWHNVAAEDDYTCHDNTLADDFKAMLHNHSISAIHDHHVFNHAVRYGKSNPHSSIGYLIHPRTAKIIVDWLCAGI